MSYIGKEPQTGAYSMLDALTASATASYSLTLDSVAFVPESANHLLVSLNGVIQKAGSSFTVSGSTLSFSSALTSSDSIDFVLALGNVLDIGTPSDSTVTNAKTNFVSTSSAAGLQIKGDGTTDGTLQLNCSQNSHGIKLRSPAHSAAASYTLTFPTTDGNADEFLKTDGSGALSWASAGGTNTPSFLAHVGSNQTVSTGTNTLANVDTEIFDIGSNFNTTNKRFTVTEAGYYYIFYQYRWETATDFDDQKAWISYNSSTYTSDNIMASWGANHYYTKHGAYQTKILAVGDTLDLYVYHSTGSNKTLAGGDDFGLNSFFGAFKLIGT